MQQAALEAWGRLAQTPTLLKEPEMTPRRRTAIELAAYDRTDPPQAKPVWESGLRNLTGAAAGELRLWFSIALLGNSASRVHAPSTIGTELEAIQWATDGLLRFRDAMDGTRLMSIVRFTARHHTLDRQLFFHLREHVPTALARALSDGSVVPTEERCLPPGLLDTRDAGPRQQYAVRHAQTLIARAVAPICKLKMSHIYASLTAAAFRVPRTLDPRAGMASARLAHLFADVPAGAERDRAIARAVRCVRHAAVPAEMTETALNVLHSGFAFGPNKRRLCGRDTCPCGSGHAETVEHTFWKCARSARLLELTFAQWREVTGKTRVSTQHGRITLLGDRSCTWETEADEAEWAGLEEPWAILHKVTLHAIHTERNRDAAPSAGTRRTAAQLYQKVQSTMQRVVDMRWRAAVAAKRRDAGRSVVSFRRQWEAPGLVAIVDDSRAQLLLLMRAATRDRWRRRASSARDFRNQQNAPPEPPPQDAIVIYLAGDADPRKKNMPPPPAGYAAVAQYQGRAIFELAGQISMAWPSITTITQNLADLVAFTRALQWAAVNPSSRDRPIIVHYTSEYAARVGTGAWKAKKHKAMAEEARRAWAHLKRVKGGRAWLRHAPPGASSHATAAQLATEAKAGAHVYRQVVD